MLEDKLAIAQWQLDSCDNITQEYIYQLAVCQKVYADLRESNAQQQRIIALDEQLLKEARALLRKNKFKGIVGGVFGGVGSGAVGFVIGFLVKKFN